MSLEPDVVVGLIMGVILCACFGLVASGFAAGMAIGSRSNRVNPDVIAEAVVKAIAKKQAQSGPTVVRTSKTGQSPK